MTGHMKWETFRRALAADNSQPEDAMIPYVKGYILALEDALNDLKAFEHGDGCIALEQAMDTVEESLTSARKTLEGLIK